MLQKAVVAHFMALSHNLPTMSKEMQEPNSW